MGAVADVGVRDSFFIPSFSDAPAVVVVVVVVVGLSLSCSLSNLLISSLFFFSDSVIFTAFVVFELVEEEEEAAACVVVLVVVVVVSKGLLVIKDFLFLSIERRRLSSDVISELRPLLVKGVVEFDLTLCLGVFV